MDRLAKRVVREGYDRIASSYLAARARSGADVALLEGLLGALPTRSHVLDAGCGAGLPVAEWLIHAGHHVTGLDFSLGQLSLARSHVPDCGLVLGDLVTLPFGGESFDAVVSYYAIVHVPRVEHRRVFEELHRVLRPEGIALLCLGWGDLPADNDPESWLGVPMYWSHFDACTNLEMLEAVGFTIHWSTQVLDPMDHASHQFVLANTA